MRESEGREIESTEEKTLYVSTLPPLGGDHV